MPDLKKQKIEGNSSLLLDSLRIIASVIVLAHHATQQWLTTYPNTVKQLEIIAHAAVVVFFVLSGYLIAYTTADNNRGPRQYAVARLSRLYSVLIPALVFTAFVEVVTNIINPHLAAYYSRGSSLPRYALSLFFCNEIGWLSAAPPINGPLWSLSYEFWYYVIFGLLFYRISLWKPFVLPIIACVIAGPKIMLLMPIWIFGFVAYHLSRRQVIVSKSWIFVGFLFAIAGFIVVYMPALPYSIGFKPFFFANSFLKDWLVGIFFALALCSMPYSGASLSVAWVNRLRYAADLSFPLYVFHYPLLVLWQAVFAWRANDIMQMFEATTFAILGSVLIGVFLENQRANWTSLFKYLLNIAKPKANF
jgi:peptidoglycan/LPS O-acetylase OafA/YrhL